MEGKQIHVSVDSPSTLNIPSPVVGGHSVSVCVCVLVCVCVFVLVSQSSIMYVSTSESHRLSGVGS